MFRERLRLTTGCVRCKTRKKKCDERRPRCGFCTRWKLACSYSLSHPSNSQIIDSGAQCVQTKKSDVRIDFTRGFQFHNPALQPLGKPVSGDFLDPFHVLPIPDALQRCNTNYLVWFFFVRMVKGANNYKMTSPVRTITRGWLEAIFSSPLACYAILSYAAAFHASSLKDGAMRLFSLELSGRTERLIQARLDQDCVSDDDVLLAASVHLVASAMENPTSTGILRLVHGIKALVNMRGGLLSISVNLPFSTVLSIMIADIIASRFTWQGPFFSGEYTMPSRPKTLDQCSTAFDLKSVQIWDKQVVKVFEALRLLLLAQNPAIINRRLSDAEAWFLFKLRLWTDIAISQLQSKYLNRGNISEIATLALLIITMDVITDRSQHRHVVMAVLDRIKSALQTYLATGTRSDLFDDGIVWCCVVAAYGSNLGSERSYFLDLLRSCSFSTTEIRRVAMGFIWHEKLDGVLESL